MAGIMQARKAGVGCPHRMKLGRSCTRMTSECRAEFPNTAERPKKTAPFSRKKGPRGFLCLSDEALGPSHCPMTKHIPLHGRGMCRFLQHTALKTAFRFSESGSQACSGDRYFFRVARTAPAPASSARKISSILSARPACTRSRPKITWLDRILRSCP